MKAKIVSIVTGKIPVLITLITSNGQLSSLASQIPRQQKEALSK